MVGTTRIFSFRLSQCVYAGPCQFPTLGFVVSRFDQAQAFRPEKFWHIYLALSHDVSRNREETPFTWRRGHLFDFPVAYAIYEGVLEDNTARDKGHNEKYKEMVSAYLLGQLLLM